MGVACYYGVEYVTSRCGLLLGVEYVTSGCGLLLWGGVCY